MADKELTEEQPKKKSSPEKAARLKAAFLRSTLPADHPLLRLVIASNPTDEEKSDPVQEALDTRRQEILDAEKAKKQKRQDRLGGT